VELLKKSSESDNNMNKIKSAAVENAKKLEATLESFGVGAKVINVSVGPAFTRYELQPALGVKVSRIVNLTDDIALNLASSGVRIEAPIPGKAAIGIEIPNKEVAPIGLRSVLESNEFQNHSSHLAVALGKDISGDNVVIDLAKMPHILIAGATGSGKSVCINSIVVSILYKASPDDVKLLMIDPKVVELGVYNGIPHLLIPVVTDPNKAAGALRWAVSEMTTRYKLFADRGVRDLLGYNASIDEAGEGIKLPQIVIIIDELADLMMVAPHDVEDSICRLAQMARAAGMHLVIATQRPSVNVITGVIKANIPSRIAFAVSSQVDSRTILDMAGAEKLLGKGDMLYYPVGIPKPIRVKGAFVTDKEVELAVDFVKNQVRAHYDEDIIDNINEDVKKDDDEDQDGGSDELLNQAIEAVIDCGQASVSFIQRKFKVGYARAGRIIDQMTERNIISGYEGSKPRRILVTRERWEEMKMSNSGDHL
jgi:S-DNA-T family DNA segregation ATPase FtsK/SpoIIIE